MEFNITCDEERFGTTGDFRLTGIEVDMSGEKDTLREVALKDWVDIKLVVILSFDGFNAVGIT